MEMSEDGINSNLLAQEYSNNTNQSNNLPFIPLNHSNQSNFSKYNIFQ